MSKAHMPLSPDLIMTTKGSAAPVSLTSAPVMQSGPVQASPANDAKPKTVEEAEVAEPTVTHNFRVKKSFKKAFDRAALDADMNNVTFLQYLFQFYQEHQAADKG